MVGADRSSSCELARGSPATGRLEAGESYFHFKQASKVNVTHLIQYYLGISSDWKVFLVWKPDMRKVYRWF